MRRTTEVSCTGGEAARRGRFIGVFIAVVVLCATLAGGRAIDARAAESPVEVRNGAFGLFDAGTDGANVFVPTQVVPHVVDQSYGWVIALKTTRPRVHWREEFTLPSAPDSWGAAEPIGNRTVSGDSRTSTTERDVEPVKGLIHNAWSVAAGDPVGTYRIRVFVEGQLAATFSFEVR